MFSFSSTSPHPRPPQPHSSLRLYTGQGALVRSSSLALSFRDLEGTDEIKSVARVLLRSYPTAPGGGHPCLGLCRPGWLDRDPPFKSKATARGTATPTPSLKPLQSLVLGRRRSAGYASFSFLALGPRPLASRQGWVSAGFGTQFLAYGSEDKQN